MISILPIGSMVKLLSEISVGHGVLCFNDSSTDINSITFFIIKSAIVVMYENQTLASAK